MKLKLLEIKDKLKKKIEKIGDEVNPTFNAAYIIQAERALKYYDYYRRVIYWVFAACCVLSVFKGEMAWAGIFGLTLHFHIFLNQIWWKLRQIEYDRESKD